MLRRYGYLSTGGSGGGITWTGRYSGTKTTIYLRTQFSDGAYLQLNYEYSDRYTSGETRVDCRIHFTSTPCRYGGKRYWFLCSCGRRVGVLYRYGKDFVCRHCCHLAYESQNLSGRYKGRGRIISFPELQALRDKAKRPFYRGYLTKKMRRYLMMCNRGNASFTALARYSKSKSKI